MTRGWLRPGPRRSGAGRFRWTDAFREATHGVVARPGRTLLPASVVLLGVALAVVTVGTRSTQDAALRARLASVRPATVLVSAVTPDGTAAGIAPDVVDRIARTPGVVAVGERWTVTETLTATDAPGADGSPVQVHGFAVDALRGLRGPVDGRTFDEFAASRGEDVAVVTRDLARAVRLAGLGSRPTVLVAGVPLTVTGIVAPLGVRRGDTGTDGAVIVPLSVVDRLVAGRAGAVTRELVVTTERGQTGAVIDMLEAAFNRSEAVLAFQDDVDTTDTLRAAEREQGRAGLVVVLMVSVLAFLSILVTSLGSVARRIPEIGLRRAVGARPVHIGAQILLESTAVAVVAGVAGAALGTIGVVVVALARGWTPVLGLSALAAAVLGGTVVAVAAAAYPALRATLVDPITALRRN